jgi:hypothetical protein
MSPYSSSVQRFTARITLENTEDIAGQFGLSVYNSVNNKNITC